jgi:uncharacterized protein YbaR (Trm112 family)
MFIELVDALRCPTAHEESWLVAAAARMSFRHIVEGTLGCPVCHAQYPIHRGVVDFRRAPHAALPPDAAPDGEQAMRLAALLDLTDATGFAVLLGPWSVHAPLLRAVAETPLVVVDPPEGVESPGSPCSAVTVRSPSPPARRAASPSTAEVTRGSPPPCGRRACGDASSLPSSSRCRRR